MNLAKEMLTDIQPELDSLIQEVQAFAKKLEDAGSPVIFGKFIILQKKAPQSRCFFLKS